MRTKSYVLIGTTMGDDLIASWQVIIATSTDREELEALSYARGEERREYLATHVIPYMAQCGVYASERIVEVEQV